MMLTGDRKKAITIIMSKKKNGMDDEMSAPKLNENGDEVNSDDAMDAACDNMMQCLERKDKEGFKQHLKDFVELTILEQDKDED